MAATANRRHQRARTVAMLSAALASGGIWSSFSHADTTYTYTGTGGTTAAPTSDNFSTGFGGTAPVSSTTTEIDFPDTGSPSGYTATDDFGGFTLDALTLGNNTSNTDTIAGTNGSSLYFSGASTTIAQNGTGAFVISDTIGIDPNDTLTFGGTGAGTVTVSGSIGGGAGNAVTVAGANTVIFSGSNSYSGALNVNSGILNVQNSAAISGPQGYVNTGATLQLQNNITETAALQLNGDGTKGQHGVLVNNSGTNTVTGNVTFSGEATIASDSGTLIFSGGSFVDSNVLTLTGAGNGVFASGYLNIDGHAGFYVNGTGTWYFTTPGQYLSGSIHVGGGTVNFVQGGLNGFYINPTGGVLQYAANTANPDDLSNSIGYGTGSAPVAIDTDGNNVAFAGSLGGVDNNGGLIKYGLGSLTLNAAMGYGGSTTIAGGTLQIGNGTAGSLPGGSPVAIASGAALGVDSPNGTNIGNSIADTGSVFGDQGGAITNTLSGNITGAGKLIQGGTGTLILSGQNSYAGTTTINSGTLQAGSTTAFGSAPAVTLANVANTALDIADNNMTLSSLAGGGTLGGNVVLGSSTSTQLAIGSDNTSTTFGGAILGAGSISKVGNGTLTLTGSSSFTGGGNVSSGILNVQNSAALGTNTTNTFAVFSGTTLQLQGGITLPAYTLQVAGGGASNQDGAIVNTGGTNTVTGPINVNGNGAGLTTISSDAGTLVIAGGMITGNNNVIVSGAGTGVFAASSGTVNISGSNFVEKDGTGAWDFADGSITFAGNLHLNSGTVSFANGGLGSTTINANGGVLKYDTGNTQDVSGVTGNPTIQYGGGQQYNYSPIAIDTNGMTVTFNGTLSGNDNSRGLIKYGAGALILNAHTDYGSNNATVTNVLGGTLVVNGSTPGGNEGQSGSTVSVGDGINANTGVLAGTGLIGSSLTVQLGGTITAGSGATPSDTLGTLHLSGVTFNNGGTYAVKIGAGGTSDELMTPYYTGPQGGPFVIQVTGTGSATFATGEQWVIANNSSGNNPFDKTTFVITSVGAPPASDFSVDNVADGSGYDLVLTADSTPEPTTALIIVPFAAMMLGRRRRRSI